jgi:hypothetical protein
VRGGVAGLGQHLTKSDRYHAALRQLADDSWEPYLRAESGLPGPRANLELAQVAADLGSLDRYRQWLATDDEFLCLCGAIGLGRLVADGCAQLLEELRHHANDGRWRVREGVALGLQRLGARDMPMLVSTMREWSDGSLLERRAAVAALCEPPLLRDMAAASTVLAVLDEITHGLLAERDRRAEDFKVLRQALAYGWSVAVAASPADGKPLLEKWLQSPDKDVAWLARENLKKDRLKRMDAAWVERWSGR